MKRHFPHVWPGDLPVRFLIQSKRAKGISSLWLKMKLQDASSLIIQEEGVEERSLGPSAAVYDVLQYRTCQVFNRVFFFNISFELYNVGEKWEKVGIFFARKGNLLPVFYNFPEFVRSVLKIWPLGPLKPQSPTNDQDRKTTNAPEPRKQTDTPPFLNG